jgi:hypothetical protein
MYWLEHEPHRIGPVKSPAASFFVTGSQTNPMHFHKAQIRATRWQCIHQKWQG